MNRPEPIWLISGAPGAGKTSVARAICARSTRGLHVPVDDLREMVVSGQASPLGELNHEVKLQLRLARRVAATMASLYAESGFTVVIDDVADQWTVENHLQAYLGDHPLRKVLLTPTLEVALQRNATRTTKPFDTAILVPTTIRVHPDLLGDTRGWFVIDSSSLSVDETVDAILATLG